MHKATPEESALLERFLLCSQRSECRALEHVIPNPDVTALMYFFWPKELAPDKWPIFEGALKETWRNCGFLKTVLAINEDHVVIRDFASRYPNVELQIEPRLVPGDINSMSIDCNERLYQRFSTKFVLIVQDDGFPLRPGLDEFVAKGYDFIGSPYCRPEAIPNLLTRILNYCPSNGGFSLRSKRICELASKWWGKVYSHRPFTLPEMSEDIFYTQTLPRQHLSFWRCRRQAPSAIAERFSYEGAFALRSRELPFGFHTATGFATLVNKFDLQRRISAETP